MSNITPSVSDTIMLGVVSGLLTSIVAFLAVQMFRAVVLPWYRSFIYQGVLISGPWYLTDGTIPQDLKLELKQAASRITGTATYVSAPTLAGVVDPVRTFEITGTIVDRIVHLVFRHTDRQRIGLVALVVEVIGDGRRLVGRGVFYDVKDGGVSAANYMFGREMSVERQKKLFAPIMLQVDGDPSIK